MTKNVFFSTKKLHDVGGVVYSKAVERTSDDEFVVCANGNTSDGKGTSVKINLVCFFVCSFMTFQIFVLLFSHIHVHVDKLR